MKMVIQDIIILVEKFYQNLYEKLKKIGLN